MDVAVTKPSPVFNERALVRHKGKKAPCVSDQYLKAASRAPSTGLPVHSFPTGILRVKDTTWPARDFKFFFEDT